MSFAELVVVALVALIVFGPERLPEIAYRVGQWRAKLDKLSQNLQQQVDEHALQQQLLDNEAKAKTADQHYLPEK